MKTINKTLLVTIGVALTLTLSACTGCSTHNWSSSESSITSVSSEVPEPSSSSAPAPKKYKIKWLNYDGTTLYTSKFVTEGEIPVYKGDTPTRPADQQYFYTWSGWTPEVVPAYESTSYTATYSTELRTYTVSFPVGTKGGKYSVDKIENVPYGTVVHVDGLSVEVNGTVVTVEPNADEDMLNVFVYEFEGWSVEDGYVITGDTNITANYDIYTRLYNLTVKAVGGGTIRYIANDGERLDDEFFIEDAKAYGGETEQGPEGEIVGKDNLHFYFSCDRFIHQYYFQAVELPDDVHTCTFIGWYYNDEPLHYFDNLYGDVVIEARFETVEKDYTDIFTYEIDPIRMEAIIVDVDRYAFPSDGSSTLVLPRTYNGYTVAGMKSEILWDLFGLYTDYAIYIPNTFVFFEESTNTIPTFPGRLQRFIMEEGNPHFNYVDGILYNGDMTQLFTGTDEMYGFMSNNHLNIPESVTYIWAHAFAGRTLDSVSLPSGLSRVSDYCFSESHLKTVTIPNSVTSIGTSAFMYCDFEILNIPDSVTTIEDSVFGYNPYLKHVHIGAGVNDLSLYAFYYNQGLLDYEVDSRNTSLKTYNGALYDYSLTQLISYPGGQNDDFGSRFPAGVTNIPYLSCRECIFETIYIPEGIETIESHGIYNFEYLEEIHLPSTITKLNGACFFWCWNVTRFYYNGTMEQWEAIEKPHYDGGWKVTLNKLDKVICLDGEVAV